MYREHILSIENTFYLQETPSTSRPGLDVQLFAERERVRGIYGGHILSIQLTSCIAPKAISSVCLSREREYVIYMENTFYL